MTKQASDFFNQFKSRMIAGLNTCSLGKIVSYDPTKSKADVELLPGGELIKSVPVALQQSKDFFIRLPYSTGDYVVIVFCSRDIDGTINGGGAATNRMLDINDAIVIGGINLFTDSLPAGNDLIIGKKDSTSKIVFKNDGSIQIVGTNGVAITGKNGTTNY